MDSERYRAKLGLIRSFYRRGYQRMEIFELFRFINWVLALPEEVGRPVVGRSPTIRGGKADALREQHRANSSTQWSS